MNFLSRNDITNSKKSLGSVAQAGPELPKEAQTCPKWPRLSQSGPDMKEVN